MAKSGAHQDNEQLQEEKINNALLAVCLQMLTTLATIAANPTSVMPVNVVIQTAHLILDAAQAILHEPTRKSGYA